MELEAAFAQYNGGSGTGSTLEYSAPYREFLVDFIIRREVKTIADLGCGDLVVMSAVLEQLARLGHQVEYVGLDCLAERVAFNRSLYPHMTCYIQDVRHLLMVESDLMICKDVLQHWDTRSIVTWFLGVQQKRFRHSLITNCARGDNVNGPIELGGWRPLDLTRHPFSIGEVVFSWDTKDTVLMAGHGH
jgi:hypothetical protein